MHGPMKVKFINNTYIKTLKTVFAEHISTYDRRNPYSKTIQ